MCALQLPAGPWIVGHRGAAGEELENTLAGVARGIAAGAVMIEVDLRLTADEELVVFHDETFERLAGDRRRIDKMTTRDLRRVALRAPGHSETHRVPGLAELLSAVPPAMALNLELKADSADPTVFAERLLHALGRRRRVLVSSFEWDVLTELRRRRASLPLAPISRNDAEGLLAAGIDLGAWSLHCHQSLATRRLLDSARRSERPVLAYTVNRAARARELLRRGVRGVFTDHPTAMIRALERWPP